MFQNVTFVQFEGIGKVATVYDSGQEEDGSGELRLVDGVDLPVFRDRIAQMTLETKEQIGWDLDVDTRFFCVEEFFPTTFWKTSSGGIQGPRFWDVTEHTKGSNSVAALAEELSQHTWE